MVHTFWNVHSAGTYTLVKCAVLFTHTGQHGQDIGAGNEQAIGLIYMKLIPRLIVAFGHIFGQQSDMQSLA